ncbi:MAG TPA: glutamate-cysteine ligase family protein, partial [Verrucomicrobiae bacterium]|nr:glutamate-cysteine ligase family protein [Verrucomicrobiae bacterium]
FRQEIWRYTDPERSGILWELLDERRRFRDYLEYVLKMPVMFIVRGGDWIPLGGISFREFLKNGYQGAQATLNDFELHLSTAFPEARLKQYLEIRGIDGQSAELIPSVAAFWKGILYDEKTRDKAWQLVASATREERQRLVEEVPRKGLQASLGKTPILEIARELVALSCASLGTQTTEEEGRSECVFLKRIQKAITDPGKSPAETLLEKWNNEWQGDIRQMLAYLRI